MQEPDMKHVAVEVDLKNRRVRVGACIVWATAMIVVACTGHVLWSVPLAIPSLFKWWQKTP